MFEELSPYPWRFFDLLLSGNRAGVDFFIEEARSCSKCCFMDDMSRAHWAAHPSATALLSPESRAKVLAAALLVADNSAIVGRMHATTRRGALAHEQTYADTVAASSARQMLREATPLAAPERRCRDFAHRPPREGHGGRGAPAGAAATGVIGTNDAGRSKLGRGRPDLPPGECKKRRVVSWSSILTNPAYAASAARCL